MQRLDSYQLDRVLSELHRRREKDTEYRQRIIDLERDLSVAKQAAKRAVKQPEVVERVKVVYRDRVTKEDHSQCSAKIGHLNHRLSQTQKQLDTLNSQQQSLSNRAKMLKNERDDAVKRADDAEKTLARRTAEFDALKERLNQ